MILLVCSKRFNVHLRRLITYDTLQLCISCLNSSNRLNNLKVSSRFVSNNPLASRVDLPLSDNSIRKYLDYISDVYLSDQWKENRFTQMMDIKFMTNILQDRISIMDNIKQLEQLGEEHKELKQSAEEEKATCIENLNDLDEQLLDTVLNNLDKDNYENVIIELSAGVGGQEAMLFTKELVEMYKGYATYLGIEHEVLESRGDIGLRFCSILLKGSLAFKKFKYEGGIHRVQRVPETEQQGRVHTSVTSVAVLPEPKDIEINIKESDLVITTMRASGPGGQSVNTMDSAVRMTHVPSGISVHASSLKSQHRNKALAYRLIKSLLYEKELDKQVGFLNDLRKTQVGRRGRSEKIRTYNYVHWRITDHRLQGGALHNLKTFMEGGPDLEQLVDRLHCHTQKKLLANIINRLERELK